MRYVSTFAAALLLFTSGYWFGHRSGTNLTTLVNGSIVGDNHTSLSNNSRQTPAPEFSSARSQRIEDQRQAIHLKLTSGGVETLQNLLSPSVDSKTRALATTVALALHPELLLEIDNPEDVLGIEAGSQQTAILFIAQTDTNVARQLAEQHLSSEYRAITLAAINAIERTQLVHAQAAGDPYVLFELAVAEPSGLARRSILSAALSQLASINPQLAADRMSQLSPDERWSAGEVIFDKWSLSDPAAAADWALAQIDGVRSLGLERIMSSWAETDISSATAYALELTESDRNHALVAVTLRLTMEGGIAFERWSSENPNASEQDAVRLAAAAGLAYSNPDQALGLLETINETNDMNLLFQAMARLADAAPDKTLVYLSKLDQGNPLHTYKDSLFLSVASSHPEQAGEFALAQPAGEQRDQWIEKLLGSSPELSLSKKLTLFERIGSPQRQSATAVTMVAQAPDDGTARVLAERLNMSQEVLNEVLADRRQMHSGHLSLIMNNPSNF